MSAIAAAQVPTPALTDLVWGFALVVMRFAPLFLLKGLSPLSSLPMLVRLSLLAGAGFFALSLVGVAKLSVPASVAALLVHLGFQFLLGLVLAFSVALAFAALQFYGTLLDAQMGIGAARVFDPQVSGFQTLIGTALGWLGLVVFFSSGLFGQCLAGLAWSLKAVPLGGFAGGFRPGIFLILLGKEFLVGLSLVAPVVVIVLLIDVAVAYVSRMLPQVNIYFVALPIKIAIGLIVAALALPHTLPFMVRGLELPFRAWKVGLGR